MMKRIGILVLTMAILLAGIPGLCAGEIVKKPLEQVFEQAVILPYDYQGKVFLNGAKTDVYGDYALYQRNNRVLVPVRLMAYLAENIEKGSSHWQVNWDQQQPDDVTLIQYPSQKTIKLKVNSNVMLINDEARSLDVVPQKIEGRIVLPLRAIGEALGKEVAWLDGLVVMSNEPVDLESPGTLGIKDRIKEKLVDKREPVPWEARLTPVMSHGDVIYFMREENTTEFTISLYKKEGNQPAVKVELPGSEKLHHRRLINGELYYVTVINGKSELHVYNPGDEQSKKVCSLGDWTANDGWLADVKYFNDDELYIILHYGDLTMGSETLYRVEEDRIEEIVRVKTMGAYQIEGNDLYYLDVNFMSTNDNLFRLNLETGEKERLGQEGYAYGIYRSVDGWSTGYHWSDTGLCLRDGYIYALGYPESDLEVPTAIYRISTVDGSHEKLSGPAQAFWLEDEILYYVEPGTGNLLKADLEGNNQEVLVNRPVANVKFHGGNIYYIASSGETTDPQLGYLYKYDLSRGQEIRLSKTLISDYEVGKQGIFYKGEGYDLGLYKIEAGGNHVCITDDTVDMMLLTDEGLLYTLRYQEGIFRAEQ